jgi:serine phosphatase RsbU (regulator of sigma subunit)
MANILVVDDIEDNVYLLKLILEGLNHTVLEAYNGQEALDVAFSRPVDLVLLDVMMPVMNGLEVASRLKADPTTKHVPIILLTARKHDAKDMVEGLEAGADEYVTKPFLETELVARVNSMLRIKRLYDQVAEAKAVMEEELVMAQAVQRSLLPQTFPYPDRLAFAARYRATSSIGGDFYDALDYGDGYVGVLIADVSGHGPSAALIVSMLKVIAEHSVGQSRDPQEIAHRFNRQILAITPEEQYLTMFFGMLSVADGTLTYIRGGHPYPLLLRVDGTIEKLTASGELVGLFEEFHVDTGVVTLAPGDRLFAYSDGIIETLDVDGAQYGMQRLEEALQSGRSGSLDETVDRLLADVEAYNADDIFNDDVAIIAVERLH